MAKRVTKKDAHPRLFEQVMVFRDHPMNSDVAPAFGFVQQIQPGQKHLMEGGGVIQEITASITMIEENSSRLTVRDRAWWIGCYDAVSEKRPGALEDLDGFFMSMEEGYALLDAREQERRETMERKEKERQEKEELAKFRSRVLRLHKQEKSVADIAAELGASGEDVAEAIAFQERVRLA